MYVRQRGGDLITSIEPVVQEKLDQILIDINAQYGSTETGGIIMDPKTGEIIALDTAPSFNANDFFANGNAAHFGNPLVEHRYEFGSIVKALTMAAGLDAGVINCKLNVQRYGLYRCSTTRRSQLRP